MDKFFLAIISGYLLLVPFYVFPSGLPQPSDILIAFGGLVAIFSKEFRRSIYAVLRTDLFKYIKALFIVILFVNICNWFYSYAFEGLENRMYFSVLYYLFNFMFMSIFVIVLSKNKNNANVVVSFIFISLLIQFVLAILGIQGSQRELGSRGAIFFNNPNQLGYYALLMLTLFAIIPSKIKTSRIIIFSVIFISLYLVLNSGSRAALPGVLFISIMILYKEGLKFNFTSFIIIIVLAVFIIPVLYETDFVQNNIALLESRNIRDERNAVSQIEIRAYDRILNHPEYLFFGAGEGLNSRFISYHQGEIHSAFGTMLFSYGFLGFILFMSIIYESIRKDKLNGFLYIAPLIVYNITHNGLRNALLWSIFAVCYFYLKNNTLKNNFNIKLNKKVSYE